MFFKRNSSVKRTSKTDKARLTVESSQPPYPVIAAARSPGHKL